MSNTSTKIVELFIDDEFDMAGIDAISLVSHPAHEENWLAFNKENKVEEPEYSPYIVKEENFCDLNPKLDELGEDYGKLISEGWQIVKVERITPQMVEKMNQQKFSKPNDPSELDTEETRVRFKYVGPQDEKNRKFCADMMKKRKVYRIEDIDDLTSSVANEQFGYYSIFLWRGSFNCRHQWVRLIYKKQGTIINNDNSTKGLLDQEGLGPALQPDTRNTATIANPSPKSWRPGQPRQGFRNAKKATKKTESNKMVFAYDEEKKVLIGAAMIPNKMIIRYDNLGNPYYVFFSKESIKKMADKFLKEGRTDETSVEHDGRKLGKDKVFITESWVSDDPIYDKSHKYGFELPAGTWFISCKIQDPQIWKMIKDKELNGFSVEGLFAEKSVFSKEDKQINEIIKILKSNE